MEVPHWQSSPSETPTVSISTQLCSTERSQQSDLNLVSVVPQCSTTKAGLYKDPHQCYRNRTLTAEAALCCQQVAVQGIARRHSLVAVAASSPADAAAAAAAAGAAAAGLLLPQLPLLLPPPPCCGLAAAAAAAAMFSGSTCSSSPTRCPCWVTCDSPVWSVPQTVWPSNWPCWRPAWHMFGAAGPTWWPAAAHGPHTCSQQQQGCEGQQQQRRQSAAAGLRGRGPLLLALHVWTHTSCVHCTFTSRQESRDCSSSETGIPGCFHGPRCSVCT
jgi:hypothetical protein